MSCSDKPLPPAPRLSQQQEDAATRLVQRATRHAEMLQSISHRRGGACSAGDPRRAYEALKTPRQSNAVGVFGRRGSGKTTVLVEALRRLSTTCRGWLTVRMPLDLSYAPGEFPYGLTALSWIHERLLQGRQSARTAHGAFDVASKSYFRGAAGFNTLVRELAVSPEHYARSSAEEIKKRLSLWRDVRRWLDEEARCREVSGFIVAIDDLDLAPANDHHSLVWSLLDELHQDRLIFLLSADLDRLERRLAEEDAFGRRRLRGALDQVEVDLPTARDLVYKVLPQVDRCELQPWPPAQRRHFPPKPEPEDHEEGAEPRKTIDELVAEIELGPVLDFHLDALLPEWARGLENVRRELAHRARHPDAGAGDVERELAGFLAESSFDFDLARALRDKKLEDWAGTWLWTDDQAASAEAWNLLAGHASGPEADLLELLPAPSRTVLPLRPERARWAEVLVDLALAHDRLSPSSLVQRMPLLRLRMKRCSASHHLPWDRLSSLADDGHAAFVPALTWTEWEPSGEEAEQGRYTLGLPALLGLCLRTREPWPDEVERKLYSSPSVLVLGLPSEISDRFGSGRARDVGVEFLPRRARTLIRFLDALGRQPWSELGSLSSFTGPIAQARLAATFIHASLRQLAVDETGDPPDADWRASAPLVAVDRALSASPEELLSLSASRIRDLYTDVVDLAAADLDQAKALTPDERARLTHPATAALIRFLEAPFVQGLDPALDGL